MNQSTTSMVGLEGAGMNAFDTAAMRACNRFSRTLLCFCANLRQLCAGILQVFRRHRNHSVTAVFFLVATATTANLSKASDIASSEPSFVIFLHGGEVLSSNCCAYPIVSPSEPYWFLGGAFSTPIGEGLGLQMDLVAGQIDDEGLAAASAHVFTRYGDSMLVGAFASSYAQEAGHEHVLRFGLETEIYVQDLTLLAQAGYRYTDLALPINEQGGDARPFFGLGAKWYLLEDLMVGASVAFYRLGEEDPGSSVYEEKISRLTFEWKPDIGLIPGASIRMDWTIAEDGYETLVGGVSYQFGGGVSLKERDRKYMISRDVPPLSP